MARSPSRRQGSCRNGSIRLLETALGISAVLLLVIFALSNHEKAVRGLDTFRSLEAKVDYDVLPRRGSPLDPPPGKAEALPSIRVQNDGEEVERGIYGGKGDKKHLGGFTEYDGYGVSPAVWKHMISDYGIKSVVDLGCGKGVSTLWFHLHGAKVLCVEGSHDAVKQTLLPDPRTQVVEHDFSRGPYWPEGKS